MTTWSMSGTHHRKAGPPRGTCSIPARSERRHQRSRLVCCNFRPTQPWLHDKHRELLLRLRLCAWWPCGLWSRSNSRTSHPHSADEICVTRGAEEAPRDTASTAAQVGGRDARRGAAFRRG
eukprot:4561950-Prymnesium_polylepis.2